MLSLPRLLSCTASVVLATLIAGCSTFDMGGKVWYKPGGTVEERDRLLAAAQVQATQAEAAYDPNATGVRPNARESERHTILTYMTAAGWSLVPKSEAGDIDNAPSPATAERSTHTTPLSTNR